VNSNYELIKNSKEKSKKLGSIIINEFSHHFKNKKIIFIDYPVYLNVGDLLIKEGTEQLFKKLNTKVIMKISERNQERLFNKKIDSDIILVLHGGGNFGDLYMKHQSLREKVISSFPNNKIILMPQSIHYENILNLKNSSYIYNGHNNLEIYVRDKVSFNTLSENLNVKVKMLPDMAFVIDDKWNEIKCKDKTLILRRRDVEAIDVNVNNDFDWDDMFSRIDIKCYKFIILCYRIENKIKLNIGSSVLWDWFCKRTINKATKLFKKHNIVDTDRLHGMILAFLVGCDVIKKDNSYGKLDRFYKCWFVE